MAQLSEKDLLMLSSPESHGPDWPTPPAYVPLWDVSKLRQAFEGLVTFRGSGANPVISESDVLDLFVRVLNDYDQELSKARFALWQCQGISKP